MLRYLIRRVLLMIPTLVAISMLSFLIIQLPPGDFLSSYVAELQQLGQDLSQEDAISLRVHYGLDRPMVVQYWRWFSGLIQGDLGISLQWRRPVSEIIGERLPYSMLISLVSFVFVWVVSIPIGMYSAVRQYSVGDYIATFFGFFGLATPDFLFALIVMWLVFLGTGNVLAGLFSSEYIMAAWSWAKLADLLKHLWVPMIIIGTSGTAGAIRVMRANMLDEIERPYVMVARSKGLPEMRLLFKYPFRIAVNPTISTIGYLLPSLVGGELLVSIVMGIPSLGPILMQALLSQDMFLAGSIVMILSSLTVIGTLISDLLLAWVDPRIRGSV
jgi:peptide/nickel transport system permease protein